LYDTIHVILITKVFSPRRRAILKIFKISQRKYKNAKNAFSKPITANTLTALLLPPQSLPPQSLPPIYDVKENSLLVTVT